MEERLKSISRNQLSSLALKLFTVFASLVWYRNSDDIIPLIIFAAIYWLWYLKPSVDNDKFWASASINFLLALFVPTFPDPRLNALIILTIVTIYGVLIGVKNLIFLKRETAYYFGQFLLTAIFSLFILLGRLDIFYEIIIAAGLTMLFTEFYMFLASQSRYRATLWGIISAFLTLQLGLVISLVPKPMWAKVGLLTLIVFMIMELTAHYFRGQLDNKRLKRDLSIAFIGITAMLLF